MQQLVAEAAKTIPPQKLAWPTRRAMEIGGGAGENWTRSTSAWPPWRMRLRVAWTRSPPLCRPEPTRSRCNESTNICVALRKTESVNQRLFNSLHQELISYRDNFLRESLQKPFIRDLVVLFDDLNSLAAQLEKAAGTGKKPGAVAAMVGEFAERHPFPRRGASPDGSERD